MGDLELSQLYIAWIPTGGVNYILKIIFSYKINCTKLTTGVESLFEKLMDLPENDLRETVGKVGIPSTYSAKIL